MANVPMSHLAPAIDSDRVAYWYFRLNGFLQTENFVVHPGGRGGQRTEADLLGVRFRHRAERFYDHVNVMRDDDRLRLDADLNDVVIVEVKNGRCDLNGPWTNPDRKNVQRVLAAIGLLEIEQIPTAANDIYKIGTYTIDQTRIRLVSVGAYANRELEEKYPSVVQITFPEILDFMWHRFREFRNQKSDVSQLGSRRTALEVAGRSFQT